MCEIHRRGFSGIVLDNDEIFFQKIIGVIESVDELSSVEITKGYDALQFRVAPSLPLYTNMLLQEILKFSNLFGWRIDMSKSMKTSSVINFKITTN